jgi:hypothetical protein
MAAKKYSAEKLKYFEELIQKELKESIAYLDDINGTKAKAPAKAAATSPAMPFTRRTRGLTPTLWSKT